MNDIQELLESGIALIEALAHARHARVVTVLALAESEQSLALAGALAENRAIAAAGGEKALGSNADARKRALIIALGHDEVYQRAHALFIQMLGDAKTAQAQVDTLENTLGLLKASLYAGTSRE